jgi:NADH-quinone oxidoreductase subunit N
LSLAGIPPLAGFWGKYFVFLALIQTGHYTLATVGVLFAVVGLAYYARIFNAAFVRKPLEDAPVAAGPSMKLALALTAIGTIVIGIFPNGMIQAAQWSMASLPGASTLVGLLR